MRRLSFGAMGLLVLAGVLCAVAVDGLPGEVLAFALLATGLGGAVLLLFLEVGLGEDHDRAHEEAERRGRAHLGGATRRTLRARLGNRPRRPD